MNNKVLHGYIIYDRVFSKQTLVFPEKKVLNELKITENSEIVNANISDDKFTKT